MHYKTYAEAKIAHPDSEIVTTGKSFCFDKILVGTFQARLNQSTEHAGWHRISDDAWVICNPADHCSSLKEFLEAGFKFSIGDLFLGADGAVHDVGEIYPQTNKCEDSDDKRYILSAVALNGGCKIPAKYEQWSVHNNTTPLCELTDEQAAALFNAWRGGVEVECKGLNGKFRSTYELWCIGAIYRIKSKSERELFIEKTTKVMRDAGTKCPDNHEYFGIMFDAGARYKDLTQHFGENI